MFMGQNIDLGQMKRTSASKQTTNANEVEYGGLSAKKEKTNATTLFFY
jgi:hypothetical protein